MFEDREPIWPQGKKKHPEDYPWRVEAEPVVGPRRGRVRARGVAARRARAPAQVAAPSTGTSPSRASCARSPTPTRSCCGERIAAAAQAAATHRVIHERHFTVEEATRCCRRLDAMLRQAARGARPAHRRRGARGALHRGARQRRRRSRAARSARRSSPSARCSARSRSCGIVVRDIDRGLIDFPAILEGREVYLCWELDEDGIGFWHDLESGYGGRQPLD